MKRVNVENINGEYKCDIEITVEEWKNILKNKDLCTDNYKDALIKFYNEPGHKSTCKALGEKYHVSPQSFNGTITAFAKAVQVNLNKFEVIGTDGKPTYWIIPMEGRYIEELFEWTIRKELVQAMEETGYIMQKALIHKAICTFKSIYPEFVTFENSGKEYIKNEDNYKRKASEVVISSIKSISQDNSFENIKNHLEQIISSSNFWNWRDKEYIRKFYTNEEFMDALLNFLLAINTRNINEYTTTMFAEKLRSLNFAKNLSIQLVTYLLWLFIPEKYICFKTSYFAKYFNFFNNYKVKRGVNISWDYIQKSSEIAKVIFDEIQELKPRDMIDIQSFCWDVICNNDTNNDEQLIEIKKGFEMNIKHSTIPLNQILYGPPGTGKTYNTINKALEIIEGKSLNPKNSSNVKKVVPKKGANIYFSVS